MTTISASSSSRAYRMLVRRSTEPASIRKFPPLQSISLCSFQVRYRQNCLPLSLYASLLSQALALGSSLECRTCREKEKDGGRGEEETAPRAATFTLARTEKSRGCDVDENQIFCEEEDEISSSHRRVNLNCLSKYKVNVWKHNIGCKHLFVCAEGSEERIVFCAQKEATRGRDLAILFLCCIGVLAPSRHRLPW